MTTGVRVGLFVAALCVVFGGAMTVGNIIGPVDTEPASTMEHEETDMADMPGMSEGGDETPGGLQVAENGYRLVLDTSSRQPDDNARLSFTILAPDGEPLTDYAMLHDKKMHLIIAKRDLSGFQHVHPTLDSDGAWTASVALDPGQWRTFADFDPAGDDPQLTLGADLAVAGKADPKPLPAPSRTAQVDDYTVTLDGDVEAGAQSKLTLTVAKDGKPVTDLQPYLAAYGHLVALRDGDLAYLHVHPDGEPGDGKTPAGPGVTFYAEVPSAGSYRLYLDFKHDGIVRTAEFTVETGTGHGSTPETEHGH